MSSLSALPPWLIAAGSARRPPQREQSRHWLQRLQSIAHTLLRAPAGYGKTALLIDWYQWLCAQGVRTEWMDHQSLAQSSGGPAASSWTVVSRLKGDPHDCDQATTTFDDTATILDHCYSFKEPTFLFIDDLDHPSAAPLMNALRILMIHPAPHLHTVMAARAKPPLPIARARACGDLWELRAEALSLNDAEIGRLLSDNGAVNVTDAQIRHVATVTEGWPTGVRLVASNLLTSMSQCGSADATGDLSPIFAYFREEVLAGQSEEVLRFLYSTSVVHRLYGGLCDFLTGGRDGSKMLSRIDDAGLS